VYSCSEKPEEKPPLLSVTDPNQSLLQANLEMWGRRSCIVVYKVSQEERSIFWEVIVSVIRSKKVQMYMCPIPNGFRDRAISLYSSKIVDKKEILCPVSNTGIYCSSDKVSTVYLV
jgi:hypothetical protein